VPARFRQEELHVKTFVAVVLAAAFLAAGAGTAFAGEVNHASDVAVAASESQTGLTPIGAETVHASACAYSGAEDLTGVPGDTQTPHEEDGNFPPPGSPAFNADYNCVGLAPGRVD
jgi:hypothetical protein